MKRRNLYYIPLLLLFIIAVTYQARTSMDVLRGLLRPKEQVRTPIVLQPLSPIISQVRPEAESASVRKGDRLVSVNGQPYTGLTVLWDPLSNARPGDSIELGLQRADAREPAEERVRIQVAALQRDQRRAVEWLVSIVLILIMPVFAVLLGFWVAAVRPRDPVAWLLLGLMLSFGQLPGSDVSNFQGWMRDSAMTYKLFFTGTWPVWMMLFGIYFPERWKFDKRWPWVKWLFIIPFCLYTIYSIALNIGAMRNFALVAPFFGAVQPLQRPMFILGLFAIGIFFASLGWKMGTTAARDAKRRLRLLLYGAMVSLGPLFCVIVFGVVTRTPNPLSKMPVWIAIPALMMLFLFPLTLTYVIVVQRAMDVRMVVRQGVQYALARNGVVVLQLLLSAIIIFAAMSLGLHTGAGTTQKIIAIIVSIALIFVIRRLAEKLRGWTDRRFFREAYNAEQILSDLSQKVRTMVETGPLLETVARRISESLHVPRIALLLQENGSYRPAHALGYGGTVPAVAFNERAATVERLRRENEPLVIYADDPDSWVHKMPGVDGELAMLERLDTQLLLPLNVKEKLPGFISLGPKQSEEPYSNSDLRLLQSVATQTGLALENSQLTARIASEVAQRELLNREVEIAREVQERLFPQNHPSVSGLDYCGACRPALGVGGDYYDFLLLPNERFGIAVGDVSGKGISAALLMASLQACLRGQATQGTDDLAGLIGNVNRLVYDASAENRYATFFYAQYQPATRNLSYVNAGHNPPMIFRRKDETWEVLRLDEGGCVVGLMPDFPYTQASVTLQTGDLLVAYTDGISEAMNPAEEEWGEERMMEAVKGVSGLTAVDMLSALVKAADEFAAGAKQHDDMTLVVIRVV